MILTLLPPLKMGEPPPDPPKTEPKKPEQMVPASSPAKKVAAVPARTPAGAETNSAAGPPLAADSPNESLDGSPIFNNAGQPVIQPQRLVRFFQSPGTNGGSDVHLAVPDGFTPPGAAARPSSGAAYISK
jgi:hypothetical protein